MPSSDGRLIDKVPIISPRPVDMQVLSLGMSRTGTMSMQSALQTLGYKSYHMAETANNPGSIVYWLEALKAKYLGQGKPYAKAEFDKLLGNYSAITDIPCIMFVDELLAAYPEAKVVLTERDVESWMVSMNKTFYEIFSWKSFYYLAPLEPKAVGPYWESMNLIMGLWTGGDFSNRGKLVQSYRDHYEHVRSVVPKEKILEFKAGDGYEPLCRFLGKPVPKDEQYPHINRPDNIITIHKSIWWFTIINAAIRVGKVVGAFGVVGLAAWYYRYKT